MWLATKLAARSKVPPFDMLQKQLGVPGAILYKRLAEDHPEVERGPDESLADHLSRLKKQKDFLRSVDPEAVQLSEQRARDPRAQGTLDQSDYVPPWAQLREQEAASPTWETSDLKGMPQRIPGWFTGDAMDAPPPGYGKPGPVQHVNPRQPGPLAPQQSMREWLNWLSNKGITVNEQLMRPDAAQLQRGYRPRGQDIWKDLIDFPSEYRGRHRAAKVVVAYVTKVLGEYDPVAAFWKRHNNMLAQDWKFHESGSGNYYEKTIDGKTHRIMGDSHNGVRGWTHQVSGGMPQFYPDLNEAVVAATTGKPLAGFALPQRSPSRAEDESYSPEREERTRPVGNMVPPEPRGRYQTLSYSFRWEEQ